VKQSFPVAEDENVACDECGNFDVLEIGGRKLCSDCVTLAGSGCGGSPEKTMVKALRRHPAWLIVEMR
jgi:hypothetical protein